MKSLKTIFNSLHEQCSILDDIHKDTLLAKAFKQEPKEVIQTNFREHFKLRSPNTLEIKVELK